MFSWSIPALVTPFTAEGAFDEASYRDLVEWQIAEGSSALVACGTTGEVATLTAEERSREVRVCVDQAKGRVPVIAGAGSDDTRVAVQNLRMVREAGADAAPWLYAEFQAACRAGDYSRALHLQDRLFPLHAALFTDVSPGPVKYALTRVRPSFPGTLRKPMTWPNEASRAAVDAALAHAELV